MTSFEITTRRTFHWSAYFKQEIIAIFFPNVFMIYGPSLPLKFIN